MLVPYQNQQRGNVLTAERIRVGMTRRGFVIECRALKDEHSMEEIRTGLASRRYRMVHGFHALHFARALQAVPQIRDCPLLLTTTGTDIHYDLNGPDRRQVLSVLHLVRHIVVFHPQFRNLVKKQYPEAEHKLEVIPQGVWLEKSRPRSRQSLGLQDRDVVFALPSGLRPVKNIELAVEGLALLHRQRPQIRLLLLGAVLDPDYADRILERINRRDWIRYLGEIDHKTIGGILAEADVAVNCSLAEGQPQAVLEAMSLGKPALLSAVPGNLGVIEDAVQGFYFQTAGELAEHARELADNRERRQIMGGAAKRLVDEHYRLENELDAYEALYKGMGTYLT